MSLNRYLRIIFGDEIAAKKRVRALPPEGTSWRKLIEDKQVANAERQERKRRYYADNRAHELDLYRRTVVTEDD